MKLVLPILFWLWPGLAIAQAKEVSSFQKKDTMSNSFGQAQGIKPEILTSGFIDIVNNGQVNASARFIRLFIGEQGKFAIPLFKVNVSSHIFFTSEKNVLKTFFLH